MVVSTLRYQRTLSMSWPISSIVVNLGMDGGVSEAMVVCEGAMMKASRSVVTELFIDLMVRFDT